MAQAELDALFKLIGARNEALSAKKAYYDFDKSIKDKTKDIQSLESQIAALNGIETAEAKAQKAKLEADLSEAKEDLNDTLINHSFELSQDALNELKTILQDEFDDKWDNIWKDLDEVTKLMKSANELTTAQTDVIGNALNQLLSFYGIDPVDANLDYFGNATGNDSNKDISKENSSYSKVGNSTTGSRGSVYNDKIKELSEKLSKLTQSNKLNITPPINSTLREVRNTPNVYQQDRITRIEQNFGSLLNVEGNVDSTVVSDLNKFAKQFYKGSYEYAIKEIAKDARKVGIKA